MKRFFSLASGRPGQSAIVLSVLAAVVATSVYSYRAIDRELTELALARRASVSYLAAAVLAEKFDRLVDIGISLATRVRFRELVEAGNWADAVKILSSVPSDFPFIDRIALTDLQGTLMADVPAASGVKGRNFADRDWYQAVTRTGKPYISQVYKRAAAPQVNVFVAAVPIRSGKGKMLGLLILQVRPDRFFDWTARIEAGSGGLVYVVDRRGILAVHPKVSLQDGLIDYSSVPAVQRALRGQKGVEIAFNPIEGEERVVAYEPVARHGWGVILEQPTASVFAARNEQLRWVLIAYGLILVSGVSVALLAARIASQRKRTREDSRIKAELLQTQAALAKYGERLNILHEIDRAIITAQAPEEIAEAALRRLRELIGAPRAIVNMIDLAAGEAEWLVAIGRQRAHVGPGVRFPVRLLGDVEGLKRGEVQVVDTASLPQSPHAAALLASGVDEYMIVPMIAGGELMGGLSFGGAKGQFPAEHVDIVREVAAQLAVAIAQARLYERVKQQAQELELRVAERTAQLEAANKELEGFSFSVSHDLRSPLRAIDGYAQIIAEDYADRFDEEGLRLFEVIRKSSQKMAMLIDDLLAFSRLGRQAVVATEVDMNALVGEVLAELRAAGEGKTTRFEVADLPRARGDRSLLKQVWTNLLSNAIKFSGGGDEPVVEVSAKISGAESVYRVKDNGVGFDMRYSDKLFGVFQRMHSADEFPGTGVGLAIVHRVLSRHGGRAWAESRPNHGAEFFFALPNGERSA